MSAEHDCPKCGAEDGLERQVPAREGDPDFFLCLECGARYETEHDFDYQGDGMWRDCSAPGKEITAGIPEGPSSRPGMYTWPRRDDT